MFMQKNNNYYCIISHQTADRVVTGGRSAWGLHGCAGPDNRHLIPWIIFWVKGCWKRADLLLLVNWRLTQIVLKGFLDSG